MNEKKEKIIKASIQLFAKKGFSSTTIQEIADECGISKGAFYLHFKSKEQLFNRAFEYYIDTSMQTIEKIRKENQHLAPREIFQKQIAEQFQHFAENKDFIILILSENIIPENQQIKKYSKTVKKQMNDEIQISILTTYGQEIEPYVTDLSVMIQGIIQSYVQVLLLQDQMQLSFDELSSFILERFDDLVHGLLRSQTKPILKQTIWDDEVPSAVSLQEELRLLKLEHLLSDDTVVSIEVIEEELAKAEPRKPVIQGMLTNLEKCEEPAVLRAVEQLKLFLQ
ncbi:TetR/AcrR family transcriptional regulator [Bacillus safensis]|uniref:TetR/AcrR family transcriptional regulator n=1 Tax=Bacillus safensis TaxID=561879 RepID=UPI0020756240|nr:TetR/AcrR family transcriptional regulator [Bacillus safensis]USD83479.1 TetR/AcrR family transcriptional regulator [Bacillus safensis]